MTAGSGDEVAFLDDLVDRLAADGVRGERRRVPYEFQRGGDSMLVPTRADGDGSSAWPASG